MKQGLIIIDVQNDYFPTGKFTLNNTELTLQNTLKLQKHFRAQQLPIFYIQHIKSDPHADFFANGSLGAEIHPSLLPLSNLHEYLVKKTFPNSFYQTELQKKLQQEQIQQMVICGMMSHMCVDSTTRHASELGYQPILIHDACTTCDLEFDGKTIPSQVVHNNFMSALTNFASVVSCEMFVQTKLAIL
ncbi:MAG: cysteine hydrolase [Gilliamella sp.]|uniref:cysteine hydrolase family protein n=1 Tax=Gilliamella sp. TaxID=1891236 RepID=UPI0025DECC17|nr:cysteine hydrolase family protein [Gilliamella sp.]MCO6549076.1 cysteine hydrolase [Gilliamella sp.]